MKQSMDRDEKIQAVKDLTSSMLHKYYCENDVEAVVKHFDDKMSWLGAGEGEYAVGIEIISGIF